MADRIAELAPEADVDGVKTLAESAAKLLHGPQGGQYLYDGRYDEHRTSHAGEDRERPTGFAADSSS